MPIELVSARISVDEGNLFYQGSFTLQNYLDGGLFNVDTPFSFNMYGEVYAFVVDSKTFEKPEIGDSADLQVTINCLSPAVQLIAPRALPISRTWGTTTARTVVEEVLNGYPMSWQILDWPLTANLFAVQEQTPLEIVRTLVEVVGAVVESLPDGSLIVRYKFPVAVPTYGPGTADHVFSESDELVSGREGFTATRVLDRFRVMNSQALQGGDRLEFEDLGAGQGIVRAYPSPWRTTFNLTTTRSSVVIGPQQYEQRQEREIIEIVGGKGSVRYPVLSVVSIAFLDTDLTGVVTTPESNEITTTHVTQAYSLLEILYTVRCLRYDVTGVPGEQVQFLMEEP